MNHTVATPDAEPQSVRPGINETRFFSSLQHLFAGSFSMVGELMQNARRAGATKVAFEFDPEHSTLTVVDDGHGIRDFQALIQLCESSWDEQTMLSERPFGMGLFSLLFAARQVTFRSCGKRLTVALQDVIDKRALDVVPDVDGPVAGTRIELADLSTALMQTVYAVPALRALVPQLAGYALCNAIRVRACGFPIPVFINGIEMERPYAQVGLPGELTPIGFVSIRAIHQNAKQGIGHLDRLSCARLFLQGLPVGRNPSCPEAAVVHLDSTAFVARMPDRADLYDSEQAGDRITAALRQLARDHLVRQKAALSGREFVLRHWDDCRAYDLLHLLNDIPWIPREAVKAIESVAEDGNEVHGAYVHGVQPEDPDSALLISRQEVLSGQVTIWRNMPDVPSESDVACLVMKIAQREHIGALTCGLHREHWLYTCSRDVSDLEFRVVPVDPRGSASIYSGEWAENVEIQLAQQVKVAITSTVDPMFSLDVAIKDDWVFLPANYGTRKLGQDEDFGYGDAICYLAGGDGGRGHPADALSTFKDESEQYRDEWRERTVAHWQSLVSGLRGESLANVVASGLNAAAACPSEGHAQHIAIVRTRRDRGYDNKLSEPKFSVVDAERNGFWDEVSRELEAMGGDEPLAGRIRAAFYAVVKPGEEQPPKL